MHECYYAVIGALSLRIGVMQCSVMSGEIAFVLQATTCLCCITFKMPPHPHFLHQFDLMLKSY